MVTKKRDAASGRMSELQKGKADLAEKVKELNEHLDSALMQLDVSSPWSSLLMQCTCLVGDNGPQQDSCICLIGQCNHGGSLCLSTRRTKVSVNH